MFARVMHITLLSAILIVSIGFAQGKKGNAPGRIEPYSITVSALQSSSATDISVTVLTNDNDNYPVPGLFKKLQVKVLNASGDAVYVRNFFHVPIVEGKALVGVTDLAPGMPVEIHALIKTNLTVDAEVLKAFTIVSFRPDLVIKEVDAPEQVAPNVPFNIEVVVGEVRFQNGATANVSLSDGPTTLATATGIVVNPGGEVSVLFQGVMLSGVGTHDLTAGISDAVPGEYDTGNNEYDFSVEVASGIQVDPASFTLEYDHRKNIDITLLNVFCDFVSEDVREVGTSRGSWFYSAAFDFTPVSPLDSIRWEARTASGTLTRGFLSALPAQSISASFDSYSGDVVDLDGSSLNFTIFVDKNSGVTNLSLNKMAGDYYYVQRFPDGTTDSVAQNSSQMNLDGFLEIRLLFADDTQFFGGGGSVDVVPYHLEEVPPVNDSTVIGGCLFQTKISVSHELSANFGSGTTNPDLLPSGKAAGNLFAAARDFTPVMTDLAQNYPNPFNPSTTINFTIAQSGPAVLKVYDILGNEVAELFHGNAEGGKVYRFTFDASRFASGMYFAKLEAGGRRFTKRMILMK